MRTLNDVSLGPLAFSALQTAANSGGILVATDDGILEELIIAVTSGTMNAVNYFDVIVNGTTTANAFSIPITAGNASATSKKLVTVAVKQGDRIEVESSGETTGTVPAIGTLILRR